MPSASSKNNSRRSQIQAVWVISMVAASTFLVLSDVFHPFAPKFPLKPTLILSAALHCAGPLLVTLLGREVHGKGKYLYFQPFAGGAVFVTLQCLGIILFVLSGILVLIFQALHFNAHPESHHSQSTGRTALHGPLALAGILSFASGGFLYRSVFAFQPTTSTGGKSKGGSGAGGAGGLWAAISKSPNAESLVVVLISVATLFMSLAAPHLATLSATIPGAAFLADEHAARFLLTSLAGFHLLGATISHFYVGWVHTPNYRLFMPFGLPKKTIVAQGTAWTGISLGCVMLVGMMNAAATTTTSLEEGSASSLLLDHPHNMYRFFGILSCGSNLCLLLNIRLTRHSATATRSRANLAFHGPFVATTAAVVQAMLVLAVHSGIVFPEWVTGGGSSATPEWEGLQACLVLAHAILLWWPIATHLLGTFVHGKAYNIWAPFNGKADFVLAQAVGWLAFTVSLACGGLFLAGGEMTMLWSTTAVSAALLSQLLIHTSVRIFVSAPSTSLKEQGDKKGGAKQHQRPDPIDYPNTPLSAPANTEVRFVNGEWLVGLSVSVAAFFMFIACDRLGSSASGHDAKEFPLKSIVLAGTLLFLGASPLVQVSGWDKFGMKAMFTPFQGSAEYVSLQAVGWTVYAILIVFFSTHGMGLIWEEENTPRQTASSFYDAIAWISQLPFVLISASLFFESRNLQLDRFAEEVASPGSSTRRSGQRGVSPRRTLSPSSSLLGRNLASANSSSGNVSSGVMSPVFSNTLEAALTKLEASDDFDMQALKNSAGPITGTRVKIFLRDVIDLAQENRQLQKVAHNKRDQQTAALLSKAPQSPAVSTPWWASESAGSSFAGREGSRSPSGTWEGLEHLTEKEREAFTADAVSYAHSVAGATAFLSCVSVVILFGIAAWMRSNNQIPQSVVLSVSGMLICSLSSFGLHAFYGPAVFTARLYKFWQPFAGGPPFIALQAFGFGCVVTCDVLAITTVMAPQGGHTSLVCCSLLSAVAILALHSSVRKFDVKAKSKAPGFLENNAEAVVSVLLLAASITLGKVHELMDPFGDTASIIPNSSSSEVPAPSSSSSSSPRSPTAVLSVAPLFLSFSALSLAVPLAAVAIRRASAQNQDLLDSPEGDGSPTGGSKKNKSKSTSLSGGDVSSSSSGGGGGGGFLVSTFAVCIKVIAPISFLILPLLIVYGFYYALQQSGVIALAILQSGGVVLLLSFGALVALALLKAREEIIMTFFAVGDYIIPGAAIAAMVVFALVRPSYISYITGTNGAIFTLGPDVARPITYFANVILGAPQLVTRITAVLQACGWWGSLSQMEGGYSQLAYRDYYCTSMDSLLEVYLALEFLVVSWATYQYYQTYLGNPEENGRLYHHGFTMWFRRVMVPHKVKYFGLSIHCENKDGKPLREDQQVLFGYHPHGIIPATAGWITHTEEWQKKISTRYVTTHGAGILFRSPGMRELPLRTGCRVVTKAGIHNSFDAGNNVQLVPGGQAELIKCRCSPTQMTLVTRHVGFIRVALSRKLPVCPILCFGEQDLFENVHCEDLQLMGLKLTGVAFPVLPMGVFNSPLPVRKRLTIVVGEPVQPPVWYLEAIALAEEAKKKGIKEEVPTGALTPAGREAKAVDEVADKYWAEVQRIFAKHKVAAGYPDQKLNLEERKKQFQVNATMVNMAGASAAQASTSTTGSETKKKLSSRDLKKLAAAEAVTAGGGQSEEAASHRRIATTLSVRRKQQTTVAALTDSGVPSAASSPPLSAQTTGVFEAPPPQSVDVPLPRTESELTKSNLNSSSGGSGRKRKKK